MKKKVLDTTTLDDNPTLGQQLQQPPTNSNINVDQEKALCIKTLDKNPYNIPMQDLRERLPTPTTYEEAYHHQDPWCCDHWRAAINLVLQKMRDYKVWHTIEISPIPQGRTPI
jgi:hypothetical protein